MPLPFTTSASPSASFRLVLPPSMMMSPGSPRLASSEIVSVVGGPAGTITHITRGLSWKAVTNSCSERPPVAPASSWALIASSERS